MSSERQGYDEIRLYGKHQSSFSLALPYSMLLFHPGPHSGIKGRKPHKYPTAKALPARPRANPHQELIVCYCIAPQPPELKANKFSCLSKPVYRLFPSNLWFNNFNSFLFITSVLGNTPASSRCNTSKINFFSFFSVHNFS